MAGPVLEARNLTKHFAVKRGLFSRQVAVVRAVDDISFTIDPGKTLGLVGESGCGKTTTAKMVLLLEQPTGGTMRFEGQDLQTLLDVVHTEHLLKELLDDRIRNDPFVTAQVCC